jgi:carbamoyl-phosphate synthase large subunit
VNRGEAASSREQRVSGTRFRVLITGAGTTNAVTVLKGIRAARDPSIQVITADIEPDCAGAHLGDAFVRLLPARDPGFGESVFDLCRERAVDLVIPCIDDEFEAWSSLSARLHEAGTRVAISPAEAITTCREKDRTSRFFEQHDIPCPPTWRADDIEDPASLPFPVIIKPRCGRGSIGVQLADGVPEYRLHVGRMEDPIVQPQLRGREVTIDTISDFDGNLLAASPRVRVQVKAGQAFRSRTIHSPELSGYARRIAEALPIVGPANIQCFLTDGGPRFIEVNSRFGAGTALTIEAGVNGPAALVALARGEPPPELRARPDVWMFRYWEEVFLERREA